MTRLIAVTLAAVLATQGCAATVRGARVHSVAPSGPSGERAGSEQARADAADMRKYAQAIPPGTVVVVRTAAGRSFEGALMGAEEEALLLQPRTRVPEPPVRIPYSDVQAIELKPVGRSANGVFWAAFAGGAAGILAVLVTMVALVDD
jgi:hypothetical protein